MKDSWSKCDEAPCLKSPASTRHSPIHLSRLYITYDNPNPKCKALSPCPSRLGPFGAAYFCAVYAVALCFAAGILLGGLFGDSLTKGTLILRNAMSMKEMNNLTSGKDYS